MSMNKRGGVKGEEMLKLDSLCLLLYFYIIKGKQNKQNLLFHHVQSFYFSPVHTSPVFLLISNEVRLIIRLSFL